MVQVAGKKCLLLIGESGSGKSTFINMIENYFKKGSLANPPTSMKVLIPTKSLSARTDNGIHHNERNLMNNTSSQTIEVQSYTWEDVTFIDTPGFADTKGPEQDDINLVKILEVAAGAPSLTGIVILLNGTIARATSNVQTVLSRLRGNIPDDAISNIIYIITNCSSRAICNFPLETLPFDSRKIVYMNNSAFSSDPSKWSEYELSGMVKDWNESFTSITDLLQHIRGMRNFSTKGFSMVLSSRYDIMKGLTEALDKIQSLVVTEEKILDLEASIKRHLGDIERNKNYTFSKNVTREVIRYRGDKPGLCDRCKIEFLKYQLKINGTYVKSIAEDKKALQKIEIHRGLLRQSCEESRHQYASVTDVIQQCNEQMKYLHNRASQSHQENEKDLLKVQNMRNQIEEHITSIATQFEHVCSDIKRICSKFSFLDEFKVLILQLKTAASIERRVENKQCINQLVRSLEKIIDSVTP